MSSFAGTIVDINGAGEFRDVSEAPDWVSGSRSDGQACAGTMRCRNRSGRPEERVLRPPPVGNQAGCDPGNRTLVRGVLQPLPTSLSPGLHHIRRTRTDPHQRSTSGGTSSLINWPQFAGNPNARNAGWWHNASRDARNHWSPRL